MVIGLHVSSRVRLRDSCLEDEGVGGEENGEGGERGQEVDEGEDEGGQEGQEVDEREGEEER